MRWPSPFFFKRVLYTVSYWPLWFQCVWGQFNTVAEELQKEVSHLLVVDKLSAAFSKSMYANIQKDLQNYMRSVIDKEWETMSNGQIDLQSQAFFDHLQANFLQYKPQNIGEAAIFSEALRQVTAAGEIRRLRLFHSAVSVPNVIWVILIGMGILVIRPPTFFWHGTPMVASSNYGRFNRYDCGHFTINHFT